MRIMSFLNYSNSKDYKLSKNFEFFFHYKLYCFFKIVFDTFRRRAQCLDATHHSPRVTSTRTNKIIVAADTHQGLTRILMQRRS